MYILRLRFI